MGLAPDLGAELEEATTACDKIRNGKAVSPSGGRTFISCPAEIDPDAPRRVLPQ